VEHEHELCEFMMSSAKELGLTIGESHAEQFVRYLTHLITWNKTINLTAIIDSKEIIIKHFIDSLAALVATDFRQNSLVLDAGSGGGFPGIPLKIVRPDFQLTLVEPVQKKCSFLNSVIGLLQLRGVSTFAGTIEQYAKQVLNHSIDTVVVRALKFDDVQKYIPALLTPKGKVILYRTAAIENQEMGEEFYRSNEKTFLLPHGSGKRVITVLGIKNPVM
jgi:16S rRNA (guanine527-N7)-methyltransferase